MTSTAAGIGALTWLGDRASAASMRAAGMVGTYLRVTGPGPRSGIGVDASSAKARFTIGVFGRSVKGIGVLGAGRTGVKGTSDDYQRPSVHGVNTAGGDGVFGISPGNGVHGQNTTLGIAVLGTCDGGIAVAGQDNGSGTGVSGTSNGTGVDGRSLGGYDGVYGSTSAPRAEPAYMEQAGRARGCTASATAPSASWAKARARSECTEAAAIPVCAGTAPGATTACTAAPVGRTAGPGSRGVERRPRRLGKSNGNAGGYFESAGAAQLHIIPGARTRPPMGETATSSSTCRGISTITEAAGFRWHRKGPRAD